jgi:Ser-tRNA(Ala) deacylase AlaX
MRMPATERLYIQDGYCFETDAVVTAIQGENLAFDRTCFYPGGGGQPSDEGSARLESGEMLKIASVHADPDEIIWHTSITPPPLNLLWQPVRLILNKAKRMARMYIAPPKPTGSRSSARKIKAGSINGCMSG